MATIRACLVVLGLLATSQTFADEQTISQRRVTTERITAPSGGVGLYEVSPDGTVIIDWRAVEAMAAAPHRSEQPIAAMMLAVRDGRWKAMSHQ